MSTPPTTTPTKLGQARAGGGMQAAPSKFAKAISGARVLEPYVFPRLNVPVIVTLVGTAQINAIEGDVWARMRELKLDLNITTEGTYELERATRVLAEAFLDPEAVKSQNYTTPFGTLEEWGSLDPELVAECWRFYGNLREIHDPVSMPLSREDAAEILEAVKKKQVALLRYFGARRLATWLTTTDALQWSSPTPSSGSSGSSEET